MKNIIIISLGVLVLILIGILIKYQRQIKSICRQLAFLKEHDSNMLIGREIELGGIGELTELLNDLLTDRKKQKHKYNEKEKLISDTYTNLSHDIRTPLTSLDGYFQLLKKSDSEEEKERYIMIIQERISSLKDMLEELFTFAKLKNDSFHLELKKCRLDKIVTELILSYYEEWNKNEIIPIIQIEEREIWIMGNEMALKRSIQNVMKNSLDHGRKEIHIILETEKEQAVIKIGNRMEQIEQIKIDQVFERFYKADTARGKSSSGLGLSIAKEFVQHMNGKISAEICEERFIITMRFDIIYRN